MPERANELPYWKFYYTAEKNCKTIIRVLLRLHLVVHTYNKFAYKKKKKQKKKTIQRFK